MNEQRFGHEGMEVYRTSIEFVALADDIAGILPRGSAALADRLESTAFSIPRHIAEGAAQQTRKEKEHCYRLARRSTTECAAILDICKRLGVVSPELFKASHESLLRMTTMLSSLARWKARPSRPRNESNAP